MAKITSKEYALDISGKVVPFIGGFPFLVELPSEPNQKWVPIFDDAQKLNSAMKQFGVRNGYIIKEVIVGVEFLQSLNESGLRVMLNVHLLEGRTLWTEVKLKN